MWAKGQPRVVTEKDLEKSPVGVGWEPPGLEV